MWHHLYSIRGGTDGRQLSAFKGLPMPESSEQADSAKSHGP